MWEMSTRGYFLFFSLLLVAIAIMVKAGDLGDLNEALEWALWWVDSIAPAVAAVFIAGLWFYTFLSKSSSLHKDRILDSYKVRRVRMGLKRRRLRRLCSDNNINPWVYLLFGWSFSRPLTELYFCCYCF